MSCASNGIRQSRATKSPATVTRKLLTVNGKPPRKGDKPECMDPRSVLAGAAGVSAARSAA